MEKESKRLLFIDLLDATWFCHNPRNSNTPCGICNPCLYVWQRGHGWRLPLLSRIKCYFREQFIKSKMKIKQYSKLHAFIEYLKSKIHKN